MKFSRKNVALALALVAALGQGAVQAQEAQIRKNLAERLPQLPKIDEVTKTPIAGIYEVRIGSEVHYTDADANYLIEGELIDLKAKKNITEERVSKLSAVDFATLPLKDALVWKQGNGKRKIAVFADPNCGYCKRFEKTLQDVKDVTVYTFVIPILGPDSTQKSKAIWCSKDSMVAWRNWMLDSTAPPRIMGQCDDSAIERNLAFSRKHRVTGTPAIVFEDGTRAPGALSLEELEKRMRPAAGRS